ncbi:MAG TPA: VOC family protein [Phycisphaerae bacterium]|nr:VOC family protein [Phycisphaerae bacterium]HRW53938.1 VOC family protein [Phycisphaerae bacterium]
MRIDYAIVFVHDMKKSVAFYRDVVGLPLKFETPHWTEFATEGSTLALHIADAPNPDSGLAEDEPAGRCRTGFSVPDLDAFHARMLQHNVTCVQPPKDQFGARIAQYADPDNLVISVSQQR